MKKKNIFEILVFIILGGLTSLSLPPLNFFLINFLTFSIFFIILFKKLKKKFSKIDFFLYGWSFGFGYFFSNLYWISISLTFDKNLSFLIPFALTLIPLFLALFYGFATLAFYFFNPKNISSAFFTFSFLFGFTEFIRGLILTGFPWNLIVYSFSQNLKFINIISLIGTYSLNLIVLSLFITPAIYIFRKSKKEIGICICFLILPILFFIHGVMQKEKFLSKKDIENPYIIRIISSNIEIEKYNNEEETEKVINELINISSPQEDEKIFFLWPEAIIPNVYQDEVYLYNDLFSKKFHKNHLIGLGTIKRELKDNKYKYFNSFSIFDKNLNLLHNYNKNKLVPFGEFLPLENLLNKLGLRTITNNFGSFTKGEKRNIIELGDKTNNVSFLPLICYEIIYSGELTKNFKFDFILNISEDGWFGKSTGPKQHFTHSIFRAIENRKYVIRSANNGMAAIVNPLGEIEQKIDYGKSGYLDFKKRKDFNKSFFSTFGNRIFIILILLYIFLAISFNRIKDE